MVIFDFDGTLYRTHETGLQAFFDLCAEYGVPVTDEDGRILLYTTTDSVLRRIAPGMTAERRAEFVQKLKWREIDAVRERGRLFDGIRELLASLRRDGITLAICGLGSCEYIEAALDRCGVRDYFRYVYHRIDGMTKSDRLKSLLEDAGRVPAGCVMVGDSITDLTAARDCGVPFIGVGYGYGREEIAGQCIIADDAAALRAEIYRHFVFSQILSRISSLTRPVIIGINGVDAAGKTFFATGLARYLRNLSISTRLIHMDDFLNPVEIRRRDDSARGYVDSAFNLDAIADSLRDIKYAPISGDKDGVVIVEGVLLYRPPIDEFFDYRVFLEISFDECLCRAGIRDAELFGDSLQSRYKHRYIPAQEIYFEAHRPKERSDLVVDNGDYSKPVIIRHSPL